MPILKETGTAFSNRLLSALPRQEYERLAPRLELVRLVPGKILYNPGDVVTYAYFPKGGMLCLLSTTESGRTVEVGMIGSEGMAGIPIVLQCGMAPYQVVVQLAGNALRIRGSALNEEFKRGGKLQELLLRYTHTVISQIAQSASCNSFHTAQERLCRWLLVSDEATTDGEIRLTQEFLSYMMGAPRTSVTAIANGLRARGLITYSRGKIRIIDRKGLEAASCECYRHLQRELCYHLIA